jgi:hypothetical protein
LNAVTALPLTLTFGVVTASNLHLLFTMVISGYGAFLLARYLLATADHRPQTAEDTRTTAGQPSAVGGLAWTSAAIAGGFYAFASSRLFYVALGQFNIASSHWIPLAVLYIIRTRRDPRRLKNAVTAGLFLTLQAWTELTYASFLLIFIALYWIWELGCEIWDKKHHPTHSLFIIQNSEPKAPYGQFTLFLHLRAALLLAFTFALGLSPILTQMLPDLRVEGDFLVEGSGFAEAYSADLLGFIVPTLHHPLLDHLIPQTNIQNFAIGQHIYLGFVLLSLLLVALLTCFRRPELRFWLIVTIIFALLCLGPTITVNGHATGLPGPFSLLQNLPFFKANRYPSRYSVMLLLSLSVVAAFALVQLNHWARRSLSPPSPRRHASPLSFLVHPPSSIFYLLSSLFLFEHLSIPLPQSDMRVPAPYQIIAADPASFTMLDLPFAWRNGFRITGPFTTQFMFGQFYQTLHQKPLLQGNTSRNPEFKFQYFTNAPILNSLLALETGHPLPPERQKADRAIAADALAFFNINYIVVRPYQYAKSDGQKIITVTEQVTLPYIETVLPVEKIHDEPAVKIYRVITPEESRVKSGFLIDTSSPLAPLYFGEGWGLLIPGRPITAQRQNVRLLLPLTGASQRLTLRVRLPDFDKDAAQSLRIELNGWQSPAQAISPDWQELTFDLSAEVAHPGLNDLWLHFAQATLLSPLGSQTKGWTPDIAVLSAGEEVGDFGHIFVNGREISLNQRGYNVAIIQSDKIETANFDTHLDPAASTALVRFLASSPPDTLIAIAAADEASAHLSEEAVRALQAIGAKGDLRGCFRCSHAFIRDPTGAAFEELDAVRPVGVTTGLGLTEPKIAAEVEWVKVE